MNSGSDCCNTGGEHHAWTNSGGRVSSHRGYLVSYDGTGHQHHYGY
jgi:hypothetical protein